LKKKKSKFNHNNKQNLPVQIMSYYIQRLQILKAEYEIRKHLRYL